MKANLISISTWVKYLAYNTNNIYGIMIPTFTNLVAYTYRVWNCHDIMQAAVLFEVKISIM